MAKLLRLFFWKLITSSNDCDYLSDCRIWGEISIAWRNCYAFDEIQNSRAVDWIAFNQFWLTSSFPMTRLAVFPFSIMTFSNGMLGYIWIQLKVGFAFPTGFHFKFDTKFRHAAVGMWAYLVDSLDAPEQLPSLEVDLQDSSRHCSTGSDESCEFHFHYQNKDKFDFLQFKRYSTNLCSRFLMNKTLFVSLRWVGKDTCHREKKNGL